MTSTSVRATLSRMAGRVFVQGRPKILGGDVPQIRPYQAEQPEQVAGVVLDGRGRDQQKVLGAQGFEQMAAMGTPGREEVRGIHDGQVPGRVQEDFPFLTPAEVVGRCDQHGSVRQRPEIDDRFRIVDPGLPRRDEGPAGVARARRGSPVSGSDSDSPSSGGGIQPARSPQYGSDPTGPRQPARPDRAGRAAHRGFRPEACAVSIDRPGADGSGSRSCRAVPPSRSSS